MKTTCEQVNLSAVCSINSLHTVFGPYNLKECQTYSETCLFQTLGQWNTNRLGNLVSQGLKTKKCIYAFKSSFVYLE